MSGGGKAPSSQTVTTETQLPDWVQQVAETDAQKSQQLAQLPYVAYSGPTVAGFTPSQLAAFQAIEGMQGVAGNQIAGAESSIVNLPATVNTLYSPMVAAQENNVYATNLRNMALTQEAINAQAAKQGTLGGTRVAVDQAMAVSAAQRQIGSQVGTLADSAWMQATQEALRGAASTAQLATAQQTATLNDADALAAVGQQYQTLDQAQIAQALQEWQQGQNWPYEQLAITESALAGTQYGATTTSAQPYTSNKTGSTIGAIASLIPTLASVPGALSSIGTLGATLGGSGATLFGGAEAAASGIGAGLGSVSGMFSLPMLGYGIGSMIGGQTGGYVGGGIGALGSIGLLAMAMG